MRNEPLTAAVLRLLTGLQGIEPLKTLFWSELNYDRINQLISRRHWTDSQRDLLAEDPVLFAGAGEDHRFQIIYCRLNSPRLPLTAERAVISKLQPEHPYTLFVFSNDVQDRWHFVNVKQEAIDTSACQDGQRKAPQRLRRITIGPEERLRTASERLALLDVSEIQSSLDIQKKHDVAFDVEAVTKQFFEGYKALFEIIQDDLAKQTKDAVWAHDYALQFLNRLMFLYFVQRKRWLGEETEFLNLFWEAYQDAKQPRDTFFEKWLSVLFFEAFNNQFHGGHRHLPDNIQKALQMAPYLNGGLFKPNRLDTHPPKPFTISDARFRETFDFLEKYNFTIAEDSPLDQEVAVDPEMIGKVYESLVNVSAEADERGDAGIFYTPRTEIDLMCRLALVDNLANHLGQQHKNLLYEFVFALEPEDKEAADRQVTAAGLWDHLNDRLQETTVVDPACGSGSFLVGMLHVLDDLQARAAQHLDKEEDSYDRKKRIIGQSLYGVDVMEWACHVAELRLWLALIIDANYDTTAAHVRKEPLLPHFSFKIRCGDSLVQEVGGLNLAHLKGSNLVPPPLKRKITHHKLEKLRFYNNDDDREYKAEEEVKEAELKLFREIVEAQGTALEQQITQLNQKIAGAATRTLEGSTTVPKEMQGKVAEWQQQVQELVARQERLAETRQALRTATDIPFVWDVAFVEVFEGDSSGFDIVVGNPPYVRQEKIADPHEREDDFSADNWRERKKLYKAKLIHSVYQTYPQYFGQNGKIRKLNAKSDLYCFFYFHSLSLLNPQGSFSFVTSNSWLDVGYGADLQEFLLRNCRIKLVLDNQVRRTFAEADVNTVIVLFSAPQPPEQAVLSHSARFVMFTVPFEHIIHPAIFEELEETTERRTTADYRVFPIVQQRLLEAGWRLPEEDEETGGGVAEEEGRRRGRRAAGPLIQVQKYCGDKWGGKYLRAPDIYWRILEKGKDKLVRLGDIAEVRRGFTTGANEFFYLPSKYFDIELEGDYYRLIPKQEGLPEGLAIEAEFLRPVVKSPDDCCCIHVNPHALDTKVFICGLSEADLKHKEVINYIRWGMQVPVIVKQGTGEGTIVIGFHNLRTLKARPRWYDLGLRKYPNIAWIKSVNDSHRQSLVPLQTVVDQRLYEVYTEFSLPLVVSLNSFVTMLMKEIEGRVALGEGVLDTAVYEAKDVHVVAPRCLAGAQDDILNALDAIGSRPIGPVWDEAKQLDHRALDAIVFAALDLTDNEVDCVYESVIARVQGRLAKAGSV